MKKIFINESQLNRVFLKEYLDKDFGMPLYKYLSMSDAEERLKLYEWGIDNDYVNKYYTEYDGYDDLSYIASVEMEVDEEYSEDEDYVEELRIEKIDELFEEMTYNPFKFFNKLKMNYYDQYNNLYWYLIDMAQTPGNEYEAPAFVFFSHPRIVKNKWLVHFSDYAYHIAKDGFIYGTQELDGLAYSGAGDINNKYGEGYDFAYEADSAMDVFNTPNHTWETPKYGSEFVLFRASGVEVWHSGDQEKQVIFYGPSAKSIIYIRKDSPKGNVYDTDLWQVCDVHNNRVLYETPDLEEVIDWAINNYEQYKNRIVSYNKHKNYGKSSI